jgi:predicted transcriptional regulator of viral defense system
MHTKRRHRLTNADVLLHASPMKAVANPMPTKVRALLRRHATVRSRDLEIAGITRTHLARMLALGTLARISRGLYALPGREPETHEGLIVVARRTPNAVFCLLTALRYHDLTTQAPFEVWLAVGHKDRAPTMDWPPLRVMRFSDVAMKAGVEMHRAGGTSIRVTGIARTVADCFKFRNKIGLDVALEALRDAWEKRKVTMDALWDIAKARGVATVMRPYLESLV